MEVSSMNTLSLGIAGMDYSTMIAIAVALIVVLIIGIIVAIFQYKLKQATKLTTEQKKITLECVTAVVNSIDLKDPYTKGHSLRVAEYSVEIARRMGISELENLYFVALLHDVGKVAIPDDILKRAGRLLPEEYQLMKQHTEFGRQILSEITTIPDITLGAKYHHEHFDGSGYNNGLRGNNIPLIARIICVADSYDAMTSARSYRRGLSKEEAINELARCSGTQFDPDIARIMIQMLKEGFTTGY